MIGLGKWSETAQVGNKPQLKARRKFSRGKFLLSMKELSSGFGESAAVHQAQASLPSFSDDVEKGDYDPAVAKTVETLSVVGSDTSIFVQEKEARSIGGILFQ